MRLPFDQHLRHLTPSRDSVLILAAATLDLFIVVGLTTDFIWPVQNPGRLIGALLSLGVAAAALHSKESIGLASTFATVVAVGASSAYLLETVTLFSLGLSWVFFATQTPRYRQFLLLSFVSLLPFFVLLYSRDKFEAITLGLIAVVFVATAQSERLRMLHEAQVRDRHQVERVNWQAASLRSAEQERIRIARELHDVIAHSMSVIAVQSRGAQYVSDTPEKMREALAAIEDVSRSSLTDLRSMLGMLRNIDASGNIGPANQSIEFPQPSISQISELSERIQKTGLCVDLSFNGEVDNVPRGIQLVIYRVIQESLTNVVKHSAARNVWITLTINTASITVYVVDDGPHTSKTGAGKIGEVNQPDFASVGPACQKHGLVGMKERVEGYGGTLTFGWQDNRNQPNGFVVQATLPYLDRIQR